MPKVTQEEGPGLVARCLAGREGAWEELVERYSRYVYAIASRHYRLAEHDAEDVFQEVFARTYEHLDTLRDGNALRSWIGQMAGRISIDRLRASGREEVTDELPEPSADEDAFARLETAMEVRNAMEGLPEHCDEILDRFFARDQSYRTISKGLGLPEGTIASRISRCLMRLRGELEGRSDAASAS